MLQEERNVSKKPDRRFRARSAVFVYLWLVVKSSRSLSSAGPRARMWELLTEDALHHVASVAHVQALVCLRRLEKRCAAIARAKARLDDCHRLRLPPFRQVSPVAILGLGQADSLCLHSLRPVDDTFLQVLSCAIGSGALPNLVELGLEDNEIGDPGLSSLSEALAKGALPNLKRLELQRNQIGDLGITALAESCAKGVMALKVLHLLDNQITDVGFSTLMPLLKKDGKLSNLTGFSIGSGITDKGMQEFAEILAMGALASLQTLYVDDGPLGTEHPALKAACEAHGISLE